MEYYVLINDVKQGPFAIEELAKKDINANTMVWAVGFSDWRPAKHVVELSDLLATLPPEPQPKKEAMPKTWLVESILVTCFCCLPFGIIGIINSTKVESLYSMGEYEQALNRSEQAKKWVMWGCGLSVACWILYFFLIVIASTLS